MEYNAFFISNPLYDTILLPGEIKTNLTSEDFELFLKFCPTDIVKCKDDGFGSNDSFLYAASYGDIIAYYEDKKLVIVDECKWEERIEYYSGKEAV